MDPIKALELTSAAVSLLIKLEPVAAKAFTNFKGFAVALFEKYTGKPITDEERQALDDNIDRMHSEFQAPIPPVDQQ